MLPAYRAFHRDLLWHQSDRELWRPLFLGRAFEAILSQGGPWNETERIVAGALESLNDYLGYRPVAVLESERQMEPYATSGCGRFRCTSTTSAWPRARTRS